MPDILIGRQPIFNVRSNVIGYELLYRTVSSDKAHIIDGDQATTNVILNAFLEIGLENLVGQGYAFINTTRKYFTGQIPIPFPPSRVVLEVLEDITADEQMIVCLKSLARAGYQIALDDVTSLEQIMPYMIAGIGTIVKVDIRAIDKNNILPLITTAKQQYHVSLLAEKVENIEEFENCRRLGFDFFQGYYFAKPNIVAHRRMDTSRLVIMRTLAKIQDPKMDFRGMEEIIGADVSLGYKLLKLSNSAYYFTSTPVKSISHAVSFIGLTRLRGWMTLLLMASIENKPHELTILAMTRARMCELIGKSQGVAAAESYFLAGLLSVLDAMMDLPMEQVIAELNVSEDIINALLHYQGPIGQALQQVYYYERGEWEKMLKAKFNPDQLRSMYTDALKWTNEFTSAIATAGE